MQTLAQWLQAQRFVIQRMYQADKRFLLDAPCNELLAQSPPHRPFYIEAERKTQAPLNYKLGHVPVHGFGQWKWDRFQRAGVPVWLVVAEVLSGELLALQANGEKPDETWHSANAKGVDRGGMVYLRKSRFARLADLSRQQGRFQLGEAAS